MLNYANYQCPVCHLSFRQEDDVVVCPDCGAPHHRGCWKQENRCAFAADHGTRRQWRPTPTREDEDSVICPNCGTANAEYSTVCRRCSHSLELEPDTPTPQFPVIGGMPSPTAKITQDAQDMATFVGPRCEYYLPRFQRMAAQTGPRRCLFWNAGAMLFPAGWLLYRKMLRPFLIAMSILLLLFLPSVIKTVYTCHALSQDTSAVQAYLATGKVPAGCVPVWLDRLVQFTGAVSLLARGIFSFAANALYYRYVRKRIQAIRQSDPDPLCYRYELSKRGGTSASAVAVYGVTLLAITLGAAFAFFLIG